MKLSSLTLITVLTASTAIADTFIITSGSDTNGQLGAGVINGNDTISIGVNLSIGNTSGEGGIETSGGTNVITVTDAGSISTEGTAAHGIINNGKNIHLYYKV